MNCLDCGLMKKHLNPVVDINNPTTWVKYRKNLCRDCRANCCTMPVEAKLADLVRMEVIDDFEAEELPKQTAKKLKKRGIIDHFNFKRQIFTLARRPNDDCIYLDQHTRRCTIYHKRPDICRHHPLIGPRPGYCAYQKKI